MIFRNLLIGFCILITAFAAASVIAGMVIPTACPKCETTNIEKMYERKEYRSWVYGYECNECEYQFER